ncbi:hydrogen gas-evolving membrane-bound hydrogenase subunit E [Bartonella sp. DGB1]|uniref:hydrogen gas-evolving membrane-bound hydrogenase subunit E n=1 Tax=Bartonella sp. DGB1 TaxID=3239807 RepID=UPI003525CDDC
MLGKSLLLALLLLPFLGAFLIGIIKIKKAYIAGIIVTSCAIIIISLYPFIFFQGKITIFIPWVESLNLNLSFDLDGLAWLFCFLIFGIGSLIILYSYYYLPKNQDSTRFFCLLLLFAGSINVIILSSNLIILYLFWELTSLFSFFLIGYEYKNHLARKAAQMSLIVTSFGGIMLFFSFILIGGLIDSYQIDDVIHNAHVIINSEFYPLILTCLLIGALSKSALFPFHFWLPNAMVAPTPVSAYLHSATIVNLGIYLLIKLLPAFADTKLWFFMLGYAGLTSLVLGAFQAIFQQDLKKLLAYSTISNIGLIAVLLSLGSPLSCVAAIFHVINHTIFKASLFMSTGVIAKETETRDIRQLKGVYSLMPITSKLMIVATAAMAGVPLLNGFLSKEMFFYETTTVHLYSWLDTITPYMATFAASLSVVYSMRLVGGIFNFSENKHKKIKEPKLWMRFPIEFLVFLCLLIGMLPQWTIGPFLYNAAYAVLKEKTPYYNLQLWHDFSYTIFMSLVAFLFGILLYILFNDKLNKIENNYKFNALYLFSSFLQIIFEKIALQLRYWLSVKGLQNQLRIIIIITIILIIYYIPYFKITEYEINSSFPLLFFAILTSCLVLICCYASDKKRIASFIYLSIIGLNVCFAFLILSAPDLALAQLLVDMIITFLTLLGLYWIPQKRYTANKIRITSNKTKINDIILAVIFGAIVTFISYVLMYEDINTSVGEYFLYKTYQATGAHNSITALLSAFRSFDTLGEILVLIICALIIFAAFARLHKNKKLSSNIIKQTMNNYKLYYNDLYIPSLFMQWASPFIVIFSIYILFQGHDNTGGGFPAGIIIALSIIVQYMSLRNNNMQEKLKIIALYGVIAGILLIISAGIIPIFLGKNFLALWYYETKLFLWGNFSISSMIVFDFGVFLTVAGVILLIIFALASLPKKSTIITKPSKHTLKKEEEN